MSSWIDDFNQVIGGVATVLGEVSKITSPPPPPTTVPKQATEESKTATVETPHTLPAAGPPVALLLVGLVALLFLLE